MGQHGRPVGPTTVNEAAPFIEAMVFGSRPPDKLRSEPARHRQGWHSAETTAVTSTFSMESTHGSRPGASRAVTTIRHYRAFFPWSGTAAPDSQEMWTGSMPVRSRQGRLQRGDDVEPPTIPLFSSEMTVGSQPDRPRIVLGPRIPLPVSQTTAVAAPFSAEMTLGHRPAQSRQGRVHNTPLLLDAWNLPTVDAPSRRGIQKRGRHRVR